MSDIELPEPFGYFCEWQEPALCPPSQTMYYGEPGNGVDDDWNRHPEVHKNLPVFTAEQLRAAIIADREKRAQAAQQSTYLDGAVVEAVARAICKASGGNPDQQCAMGGLKWGAYDEEAIAAIRAATPFLGPVVVPGTFSADRANFIFGEAYGVDWAYAPTEASKPVRYTPGGIPRFKPVQAEAPTLEESCESLYEAGHDFFKARRRDGLQGSVCWVEYDDGTMVIFTRGEYKGTLIKNIDEISEPKSHVFTDPGAPDADKARALTFATEASKPVQACDHQYHYFGDQQKRRRCNRCNELEPVQAEAPTASNEREAFEAWAENHGNPVCKVVPRHGMDSVLVFNWPAWEAWQARAALATQQEAQPHEPTEWPTVPDRVMELVQVYGDARADGKYSALRLSELIYSLRQWAGTLKATKQAEAPNHRPSPEWYRDKIAETLDDDFIIGPATKQAEAPTASNERTDALRIADLIDPLVRKQAPDHLTMAAAAKLLRALATQQEAQPPTAEEMRPDFEWWWTTRGVLPPLGSREAAAAWSAWIASGGYKAPSDWKLSDAPWAWDWEQEAQPQAEPVTFKQRLDELIEQHGSLRAVGRVLEFDAGYLSRLASGERSEPGDALLRRMGLREVTSYVRAARAAQQATGEQDHG